MGRGWGEQTHRCCSEATRKRRGEGRGETEEWGTDGWVCGGLRALGLGFKRRSALSPSYISHSSRPTTNNKQQPPPPEMHIHVVFLGLGTVFEGGEGKKQQHFV